SIIILGVLAFDSHPALGTADQGTRLLDLLGVHLAYARNDLGPRLNDNKPQGSTPTGPTKGNDCKDDKGSCNKDDRKNTKDGGQPVGPQLTYEVTRRPDGQPVPQPGPAPQAQCSSPSLGEGAFVKTSNG